MIRQRQRLKRREKLASVLSGSSQASGLMTAAKSLSARGITLLASLVFVIANARYTLAHGGEATYAAASVLSSIPALFPFLDLGLGAVLTTAIAEGRPDWDRVLSRVAWALVGVAMAVAALDAVLWAGGWWTVVLGGAGSSSAGATALGVLLFACSVPLGVGARLLVGLGLNARLVLLQGITAPVTLAASLVMGAVGVNAVYLVVSPMIALLASQIVCCAAGVLAAQHRDPGDATGPVTSPSNLRRAALPAFVVMVGLPLALQSDRVLLSHAGSVAQVAGYAIAYQAFAPLFGLISSAGSALWHHFAVVRARAPAAAQLQSLRRAMVGFGAVGVCLGLVMFVITPLLRRVITAGSQAVGVDLATRMAFGCLLVVLAIQYPVGMFLTSEAGMVAQARIIVPTVAANITVSYLLARAMGTAGPAFGSVFTFGFIFVPAAYLAAHKLVGHQNVSESPTIASGEVSPRTDTAPLG